MGWFLVDLVEPSGRLVEQLLLLAFVVDVAVVAAVAAADDEDYEDAQVAVAGGHCLTPD